MDIVRRRGHVVGLGTVLRIVNGGRDRRADGLMSLKLRGLRES